LGLLCALIFVVIIRALCSEFWAMLSCHIEHLIASGDSLRLGSPSCLLLKARNGCVHRRRGLPAFALSRGIAQRGVSYRNIRLSDEKEKEEMEERESVCVCVCVCVCGLVVWVHVLLS
jgi:hypothetical protein